MRNGLVNAYIFNNYRVNEFNNSVDLRIKNEINMDKIKKKVKEWSDQFKRKRDNLFEGPKMEPLKYIKEKERKKEEEKKKEESEKKKEKQSEKNDEIKNKEENIDNNDTNQEKKSEDNITGKKEEDIKSKDVTNFIKITPKKKEKNNPSKRNYRKINKYTLKWNTHEILFVV